MYCNTCGLFNESQMHTYHLGQFKESQKKINQSVERRLDAYDKMLKKLEQRESNMETLQSKENHVLTNIQSLLGNITNTLEDIKKEQSQTNQKVNKMHKHLESVELSLVTHIGDVNMQLKNNKNDDKSYDKEIDDLLESIKYTDPQP